MASKKISIVILTWNCLAYTKNCLNSITSTKEVDYEIIVVDNGSVDGTVDYLRSLDNIKLIENPKNVGFVAGNNQAIRQTKDTDILLLNNDVLITDSKWLKKLQQTAYSSEKIGIVGCRLLDGRGRLLHAGTYMPVPTYWGQQIGSGQIDINQCKRVREVEGVVGACMYIKREVIDKVGLLDEAYFSYFEDSDYCLKAKLAGFKTVCDGRVKLIHFENTSTKKNKKDFSAMFQESRRIFISKWDDYFHNRYETEVMWHSWIAANTGYAVSSRHLILALDSLGVYVRFGYVYGIEEPPNQHLLLNDIRKRKKRLSIPQVVYGQGDVFYKNSGKYKIGFSMLEVDGIPKEWVDQANLLDEIWVPSNFNKLTFANSGVRKPIKVMPLGVDPDFFNPSITSFLDVPQFVFLSVFEWIERKAPEVLLRAYSRAFAGRDDVVLILKILNTNPTIRVESEIERILASEFQRPPIIVMLNKSIPDYQMGALYRSANCFVLPTRGEGWCLPALEAMACGLPVIVTNWGPQTDFLTNQNGFPINVKKLVPAKSNNPYFQGFNWAEPDESHLIELMRYVYHNYDKAKEKGWRASEEVLSRFTWEHSAQAIKDRLLTIERNLVSKV